MPDVKRLLEEQVAQERFNLRPLAVQICALLPNVAGCTLSLAAVGKLLSAPQLDFLLKGLIRSAFLIELVKQPKIETTKFEVRWAERLPRTDPRHASFEECSKILESLLAQAADALRSPENLSLFEDFRSVALLPYEIPVDYKSRILDAPIHRPENLAWLFSDANVRHAITLRRAMTDDALVGVDSLVFRQVLQDKIKVKAYLTDRVLTGTYKTNREKRWETHPASVHFSTRAQCLGVEDELLTQLCHFRGFPEKVHKALVAKGLFKPGPEMVCPITLEPLSYKDFHDGIVSPRAGLSDFPVGHMRPLKADPHDVRTGHTAQNISWISAHGNRIQGSLSLEQTRDLLKAISRRYSEKDQLPKSS